MSLDYATDKNIEAEGFRDLLIRSTLGERRPKEDEETLVAMLEHADILCTAWDDTKLVGVARSVTDFKCCC